MGPDHTLCEGPQKGDESLCVDIKQFSLCDSTITNDSCKFDIVIVPKAEEDLKQERNIKLMFSPIVFSDQHQKAVAEELDYVKPIVLQNLCKMDLLS